MSADPWDSDDRIGVPVAGGARPPVAELPRPPIDPEPLLRDGDLGLGRPEQIPASSAPLTDADRARMRADEEAQALRELAEAEELLASDPAVMRWAGWFAHPLAAAFLVGSAGALGLFLYSQVLNILANVATQPLWVQYASYAGLGLLSFAVLYSMLRLMLLYVRLRQNRQIRLKGLEELHARTRLRWLAHAKTGEAKSNIEEYLRTYPIDTDKGRKVLARVGVTTEMAAELAKVRDELLDPAKYASSGLWFERFRDGFQTKLDEAAAERIKYWAKRCGVVTALAPNGLIDSLSSMYFGFALLADLCQVYNLKAGRTGTVVLLGRVFFNSYLAGQINDLEKLTEEQYNQLSAHVFQAIGAGVGSNVIQPFIGKASAKATSGILNYLLLNRLGKYACRLLRPIGT